MTDFLLSHGKYLAIIVVLVLTGVGLPIPEEVPVVAAGVLSATGQMNPWLAFVCCIIGAVLGDSASYWVGYHFGRSFVWRHPRWARFFHPEREAQVEQMLQRHGLKVFFLARFMVGVRAPMYMAAGVLKVPYQRFLLMDLLCATVVIGIFFGLSYAYGEEIAHLIRNAEVGLTVAVAVVVVLAVGVYLWRRRRRRKLIASGAELPPTKDEASQPPTPTPPAKAGPEGWADSGPPHS
jgi:membrane protein DedA with SNARE-associated domain